MLYKSVGFFLFQRRAIEVGAIRRKLKLSIPGGTKAVLRTMGLEVGDCRLPLAEIPQETVNTLKEELNKIGFYQWAYAK